MNKIVKMLNEKKLTHVIKSEVADKLISGDLKIHRDACGTKPNAFWISVDNGWEDWCDGNEPEWLDKTESLNVEILEDANIFVIDSRQKFLDKYKELMGEDYPNSTIRKLPVLKVFYEKLSEVYDGVYVSKNVIISHRLDFEFYMWDCESIAIWNTDKVKLFREQVAK